MNPTSNPTSKVLTIDCLADPHVHLRQDPAVMSDLIKYSIEGGADYVGAMPNTTPGLTTAEGVLEYHALCKSLMVSKSSGTLGIIKFLMLTENTPIEEIERCVQAGIVNAKLYPLDRTTNSRDGIRNYHRMLPLVRKCGELGMMCHFHPEHPWLDISGRDAEHLFVPIVEMFLHDTQAKIVWEHGTDGRCARLWEIWAVRFPNRFFVTLTPHHLAYDDDMDHGDVTATCKPPIKSKDDRRTLVELVGRNYPWVMLGSDSAYHPRNKKHVDIGCCACGALTAPFLAALCAHALDEIISRPHGPGIFENFVSKNARRVHDLPGASKRITLVRDPWKVPFTYDVGGNEALPFMCGQEIKWQIKA